MRKRWSIKFTWYQTSTHAVIVMEAYYYGKKFWFSNNATYKNITFYKRDVKNTLMKSMIEQLICDHIHYPVIHNIRVCHTNRFFRRNSVENAPCDSLPTYFLQRRTYLINDGPIFVSRTIDIRLNSSYQSTLKQLFSVLILYTAF